MRSQLVALRQAMKSHGVDWYLIPSADFHNSEYVSAYFMGRKYVSGFTGSAGTLVVGQDWAGLWTDGRYFIQAANQLQGSGIDLMKMGEPGVPRIEAFLKEKLLAGQTLGFDGRTYSVEAYRSLERMAKKNDAKVQVDLDLVGEIWADRPALPAEPVVELPVTLVGKARAEKLDELRSAVAKVGCDAIAISSLMDICWLLNIRGGDVEDTPVVLSYFLMTEQSCTLFVNPTVLSAEIKAALAVDGVSIAPYNDIYTAIGSLHEGTRLQMNLQMVNSRMLTSVPAGVVVEHHFDPTELAKACKNETEVKNMRIAHVKDGAAITRLMYWLKHEIGKTPMTELSVSAKLEEFRAEQEGYLGQSFSSIVAYGPNAAMCHYSPTEESNAAVEAKSFLLCDVGGHYTEGTTDTTRTFAMGPLTAEEREMFTLVLQGHLHLGGARFLQGCTGMSLDYLAREPLWKRGLDYNHGTGHGVGFRLSVHEGPQSFRWRKSEADEKKPAPMLMPGMIISDEPGFYAEGKFGVRCENLVVVCTDEKNGYGQFQHFEHMTMVPWDLDAIDLSLFTEEDKKLLNNYHKMVRETIRPLLPTEAERSWLDEATREV